MAAAKGFFDQYSVLCVFGSVVGCVIVPLITQSFESLIFSAVVITLTANRLSRRVLVSEQHVKAHLKDPERGSRRTPETVHGTKKKRKGNLVTQQTPASCNVEEVRRRREEEIRRTEDDRKRELEKREEEKKEKKARKKLERMKRKEQEKLVKEKEEEDRQRRSFERAQRRLANTTTADLELFEKPGFADYMTMTVKRASSTSSIASNCSNGSCHSPNSPTSMTFPKSRLSGTSSSKSPMSTPWCSPKPVVRPYSVSYDDSGPTIAACSRPKKRPFVRGSSAPHVISNSSCWQSGKVNDETPKERGIDINHPTPRYEAVPVCMSSPHCTADILRMPITSIESPFTNSVPLGPANSFNELTYQAAGLGHMPDANWRLYSLFGQGNVAPPAFGPLVQPCAGSTNRVPQHIW